MLLIMSQGEVYQRPKEKRETWLSSQLHKWQRPKSIETPKAIPVSAYTVHLHVLVNIIKQYVKLFLFCHIDRI